MASTSRRRFLELVGLHAGLLGLSGAGLVSLPGCGVYRAESGDAFEPWSFPGGEAVPERVAARAGLLAASPHNTQPWGLAIAPDAVEVRARFDRDLGTMDSLRREMHVGLGCCVENVAIAAAAAGRAPAVTLLPRPGDAALVARIGLAPAAPARSPLFDAIARRHTNRGPYVDGAALPGLEGALRALADEPRVGLRWLGEAGERARFREETIAATEAICGDAEMSADSGRWYRHGEEEIEEHRDGPTIDATGSGAATRTIGKALGRPSDETMNEYWLDATRGRQTTGTAFVLLHTSAESLREDQLRVGRIYQRIHLWATSQGLAMQPLNQMPERQDREETRGLPPRFGAVLADLVGRDRRAQMAFRVGVPWEDAPASPRRPLAWVLS